MWNRATVWHARKLKLDRNSDFKVNVSSRFCFSLNSRQKINKIAKTMDISVTPSELLQFAMQLKQWASMMQNTRMQINQYSQRLESQWKDPQYRMFVDVAKSHGSTLQAAVQQFETMSKELEAMSNSLEREKQQMQQRINNMRR